MHISKHHNDLLYKYEILRAKLEIRDHYFNTIVREIFENTGQSLSLVRIKLATIGAKLPDDTKTDISQSGHLVGRAIFDLKEMSRNFFPEKELFSDSGLVNALRRELGISQQDYSNQQITVRGVPFALAAENGMVFFFAVLEIITNIVNVHGVSSVALEIIYSDTKLNLIISHSGKPIDFDMKEHATAMLLPDTNWGLKDRIHLIGGEMSTNHLSDDRAVIEISIPYDQHRVA